MTTSSLGTDNPPSANRRESQVQLKYIQITLLFQHYNWLPPKYSCIFSPYFLSHNKHMGLLLLVLLKISQLSWLITALDFKSFFPYQKSWISLLASHITMKSVCSYEQYLAPAVISQMASHVSFEGLPEAKKTLKCGQNTLFVYIFFPDWVLVSST